MDDMSKPYDGGPAYPVAFRAMTPQGMMGFDAAPGMTLRDWFAGQALATSGNPFASDPSALAVQCYRIADAMLAVRE